LEKRAADEETLTAQELGGSDNVAGKAVFERRLRLPVAMRDAKVFLKLLQLDLAAHPPGAPILKLWISAQPAPPRSVQRGLFLPLTPEAEKLEITLARIISIVGEHRAGIPRLLDTYRPDAFAVERFTAPEASAQTLTLSEVSNPPSYALRIFRPARRLKVCVADGRPETVQATIQPDQLPLQGKVLWSAGPWRCSGEWWEERVPARSQEQGPWDREEWDIALQSRSDNSIGLFRIYQDVGSGHWFAHASYD
jgi:protein ImuB